MGYKKRPSDTPPPTDNVAPRVVPRTGLRRWWGRIAATWKVASNIEQGYAFWRYVPEPLRRLIAGIVRRKAEIIYSLLWATVVALLQHIAALPLWVLAWTAFFTLLSSVALFQGISAARRWREAAASAAELVARNIAESKKFDSAEAAAKQEAEKRKREYQAWLRNAATVIRHLPDSIFVKLVTIERSPSYFDSNDESVAVLLEQGFIDKRATIPFQGRDRRRGATAKLYELRSDIRELVRNERTRRNEETIGQLLEADEAEACRSALKMFTMRPEELSSRWPKTMSREMYLLFEVFESLHHKHILDRARRETPATHRYTICSEFVAPIRKLVLSDAEVLSQDIEFRLETVPRNDPAWYTKEKDAESGGGDE